MGCEVSAKPIATLPDNDGMVQVVGPTGSSPASAKGGRLYPAEDMLLVHAAKQGDLSAFDELVQRHTGLVYRIAIQVVRSPEDAEDVVQEAFMSAFEHLQSFEERARFSTWVGRIAFNAAILRANKSCRRTMVSFDDETQDGGLPLVEKIADWRPNPEQLYSTAELKSLLREALAAIPEDYRIIFLLRDVEKVPVEETAKMLGLTVSNVKVKSFRARMKVRNYLSKHFEFDEPTGARRPTIDPHEGSSGETSGR